MKKNSLLLFLVLAGIRLSAQSTTSNYFTIKAYEEHLIDSLRNVLPDSAFNC